MQKQAKAKKCGTCSFPIKGTANVVGKMHFHVSYVGCQDAMNYAAAAAAKDYRQGALRAARWTPNHEEGDW